METFLNGNGQAGGAAKGGKMSGGDLAAIIEAAGKVAVDIHDSNKRRQMDYRVGQQRLQSELGLADKAREADLDVARMNIIAQTIQKGSAAQNYSLPQLTAQQSTDEEKAAEKKKKTTMYVVVSGLALGSIIAAYVFFKK